MASNNDTNSPGFVERRKGGDRRVNGDRRTIQERRQDYREDSGSRKSLRGWLRSLTHARLGVDRRKAERRSGFDRRQLKPSHLLTKEEIADLFSE